MSLKTKKQFIFFDTILLSDSSKNKAHLALKVEYALIFVMYGSNDNRTVFL